MGEVCRAEAEKVAAYRFSGGVKGLAEGDGIAVVRRAEPEDADAGEKGSDEGQEDFHCVVWFFVDAEGSA